VRDFLGFPSLKEVECSGGNVAADVDLITSLTLFKTTDNSALVVLNTYKQSCKTFNDYSSCVLVDDDSKRSAVRTLVSDLETGQSVVIGCNVTTFREPALGHSPKYTWTISVYRESKS
jgi:hypothetical protein